MSNEINPSDTNPSRITPPQYILIDDMIDDKWQEHLDTVNGQIHSMWNYLLYNQFCEKQVIELNEKVNKLKRKNSVLEDENSVLIDKIDKMKNKLYGPDKKKAKKKEDLLKIEFMPVKRYKKSADHIIEKNLLTIYKNLNSIEDIINLKNYPKKFDFVANDKFNRLYNIIPSLEKLNNIIGMKNVKEQIFRSICYFLHQHNNINEMNHIMIMGPPGVGKTTIAQIMGDIYLQLGFLENDTFITAKRSDLIAKYLGQTADKTQKVIDSVMGGVLFIDEVYSLGNKEQRDSFAKECIDTINLNMSRIDHPWLLIVGGYEEDIKESFLAFNKGLERRFTVKLKIEGYSAEELFNIIKSHIKEDGWTIDDDALTLSDIEERKDQFKYYAGDMRKLFQFAKEHYSVRMMKSSVDLNGNNKHLIRDDFTEALKCFNIKTENDKYYHMGMYT